MNNDNNDDLGVAGQVLIWMFVIALSWVCILGLYAMTQWVFRSF